MRPSKVAIRDLGRGWHRSMSPTLCWTNQIRSKLLRAGFPTAKPGLPGDCVTATMERGRFGQPTTVVVCGGKKCSRACAHGALVRGLCRVTGAQVVRCQKICHGSVVGALDGRIEWFEEIGSGKPQASLRPVGWR